MSDSSLGPPLSSASAAGPAPGRELGREWRARLSWLGAIWFAYRRGRDARSTRVALQGLSPDALRDIGLPHEVLNEIEALQEFERGRSPGFIQYW